MIDLGIVILNYNTREVLRDCLISLSRSRDIDIETIVVDNCSSDGSAEMVRREFARVRLIASPRNGGYAYGNNLGLREFLARPDPPRALLLLNTDTLVPPQALRGLTDFLDAHDKAGVVGPKMVLRDGSLDLACRRSFPTPQVSFYRMVGLSKLFPRSPRFGRYNLTYLDENQTAEVDSVMGACMVMRTEALQSVGLLDESFFMYQIPLTF
jgi:N-acetylglucosaminyl-diphospho-decaprenol L-rhamnosyltransferase